MVLRARQANIEITVVALFRSIQCLTPVFRVFLELMAPLVQHVLPVELMAVVIKVWRAMVPVPAPLDGTGPSVMPVPQVIMVQAALFVRPVCTGLVIKVWRVMEHVPAPLDGMEHCVMPV